MKLSKYRRDEPVSVKITPTRVVILVLVAMLVVACSAVANNTINDEQRQENAITRHYLDTQPLPTPAGKSQLRQNLIEIELAEAKGVQTTSFECGGLDGCDPTHPPIKSCPSIGAPIQVEDQLSNPDQAQADTAPPLSNGGGNVTIKNMDPNGIYQGGGSGTYVLCIAANGAVIPSYWEGHVQTEFAPAKWVRDQGIVDVGPPSYQFTH